MRGISAWVACTLILLAPLPSSAAIMNQMFYGSLQNYVTNKDIKAKIAPGGYPELIKHFLGATVSRNKIKSFTDTDAPYFMADKFDTSLGTLDRVGLSYSIIGAGRNALERRSLTCSIQSVPGTNGSCNSSLNVNFGAIYGIDLSNWDPERPMAPGGIITPVDMGIQRSKVDNSLNKLVNLDGLLGETMAFHSIDQSGFVGSDTFSIQPIIHTFNSSTVSCNPSGVAFVDNCKGTTRVYYSAEYLVNLTYSYTPFGSPPSGTVPTPASVYLMTGGLMLLGFMRRLRSRKIA